MFKCCFPVCCACFASEIFALCDAAHVHSGLCMILHEMLYLLFRPFQMPIATGSAVQESWRCAAKETRRFRGIEHLSLRALAYSMRTLKIQRNRPIHSSASASQPCAMQDCRRAEFSILGASRARSTANSTILWRGSCCARAN